MKNSDSTMASQNHGVVARCDDKEPVLGHALRAIELHRLDAAINVEVLDRAQSAGSHAEHFEVMILGNHEIQVVG